MKLFYLNNPACNNGKGAKYGSLIRSSLNKRNVQYDFIQTQSAGHATEIIRNLDFNIYDAIVLSGGDGTLFEVINGYFLNNSNKRIPIGIIPIGRGNAFARDLNLFPHKWEESIDAVLSKKTKMSDVGKCKTANKSFYFINILGLGFVTDVAKTAFTLRRFGHFSYILGVFHRTVSLAPFSLQLECDGNIIERENVFVEISNTRYTGKDFLMAPEANINDGLFDIVLLNKLSRRRLLQALPKIFNGSHIQMRETEYIKARKIKITTNPIKDLTPDGQLLETTPIEIECIHNAVEVFYKE